MNNSTKDMVILLETLESLKDVLEASIRINRDGFFGEIYELHNMAQNTELKISYLIELAGALRTSEVRYTPNELALASCRTLCKFGESILKSQNISFGVKQALFYKLNIIGYLFDRSNSVYVLCASDLYKFLNELAAFRGDLNEQDLSFWNNATFCGSSINTAIKHKS